MSKGISNGTSNETQIVKIPELESLLEERSKQTKIRLTKEQIKQIKYYREQGIPINTLEKCFKISYDTLKRVLRGEFNWMLEDEN